jgi:hypothetical protein
MLLICFYEAISFCVLSQRFGHMKITTPENHHKLIRKPSMSVILPTIELVKSFHKYSEECHVKIGLCCGFSACFEKNIINQIQFYS